MRLRERNMKMVYVLAALILAAAIVYGALNLETVREYIEGGGSTIADG